MNESAQSTIDSSCSQLEKTAAMMGIELSVSPGSVGSLEEVLVTLRSLDPDECTMRGATFMVGAYLGEILRQRVRGFWVQSEGGEIFLQVGGTAYAPIAKVRKFAENPEGGDGLSFFVSAVLASVA